MTTDAIAALRDHMNEWIRYLEMDGVDTATARGIVERAELNGMFDPVKAALASAGDEVTVRPRVIDNDKDEITVTLSGKEIRGWSYANEAERRTKMLCAREFVEGFCTGRGL